ncbi:hypothetical protein DPMN_054693 [Dreissena polymorpha]|uniref:Uncharacterized protein n=1 Tax=Dreissena polymorpha TaxID=45954 RepID=A0A9D4CPD1_DREPO|nr:hypothetical protein DPMN_054693 [Dreissena polymorpha]
MRSSFDGLHCYDNLLLRRLTTYGYGRSRQLLRGQQQSRTTTTIELRLHVFDD